MRMGYVNTPAHMTASLARHAGSVWPPPARMIIRRANVYPSRPANTLNPLPGTYLGDVGWVEAIGPMIQALTSTGATVYGLVEARKDKKDAEAAEKKAKAQAAAEAQRAAEVAAAAQAQVQAQAQSAAGDIKSQLPLIIGIGSALVGLIVAFKRR